MIQGLEQPEDPQDEHYLPIPLTWAVVLPAASGGGEDEAKKAAEVGREKDGEGKAENVIVVLESWLDTLIAEKPCVSAIFGPGQAQKTAVGELVSSE